GMWTVTMSRGNIDPTFDACKLVEAAGASFIARETMLDPKKLERVLVKGFEHKGFSFIEVFSNCHVNLGRKNKMATAMANLEWIDSISMAKAKFDKLEPEEQKGIYPTGILKHDTEAAEYCDSYQKVKDAHKNKTMVQL
ncbi:MAG: 2-oxoglutarate ferredoxin oxidoreductase subunit beta, partial [Erysipelotrichia bacterium]|nr:2-oxoglutarate ferredoxin oxidoreductase subunit beta [Erysipelotrichia bacterium]